MTSDAGPAGLLEETIAAISPLDATAVAAAAERRDMGIANTFDSAGVSANSDDGAQGP